MFEDDLTVYKIYISHLNQDDDEHQVFLTKLNASQDYQWEDCAVKQEKELKTIEEHMEHADAVVILSGLMGKDEKLIKIQIEAARNLKKPVVVIRPYGMETVPHNLEDIADGVVGWNTPCIVDALLEAMGVQEEF